MNRAKFIATMVTAILLPTTWIVLIFSMLLAPPVQSGTDDILLDSQNLEQLEPVNFGVD